MAGDSEVIIGTDVLMALEAIVAAPFFVASGLLALAGVTKLRDPDLLAGVLRQAGLPHTRLLVRSLGIVELAVGIAALAAPGRFTGGAVAVLYGSFTCFLGWLIVRNVPVSSCGCIGSREAPPSVIHIGLNASAVGVAVSIAVGVELSGLVPFVGDLSHLAIPFLIGTCAIGYAAYLAVALVPAAFSSYRRPSPAGPATASEGRS